MWPKAIERKRQNYRSATFLKTASYGYSYVFRVLTIKGLQLSETRGFMWTEFD